MKITLLLLTTSLVLVAVPVSAEDSKGEKPALSPKQIEDKFLRELVAGRQAEAENFLESQLPRFPEVLQGLALVNRGEKEAAQKLLNSQNQDQLRDAQRVFFLLAAAKRSRFDKVAAFNVFSVVFGMANRTPAGECALHLCALDSTQLSPDDPKRVDEEFRAFTKLADANPDDVVIRWMLAVQCRTWNRNEEGVTQYKKIVEKWNPGPVLVHQTYGNLLHDLGRYEEALVEHRRAMEMEPAGWSYDALALDLTGLKRFREAQEAHKKAVELEPDNPRNWTNWAETLRQEGKYDEAIEKCKHLTESNPNNFRAKWVWGDCLNAQGNKTEALRRYRESLALQPQNPTVRAKVAALQKELAAGPRSAPRAEPGKQSVEQPPEQPQNPKPPAEIAAVVKEPAARPKSEPQAEPRKALTRPRSLAKSPPNEVAVNLGDGVEMELVLIPVGEFLMGSPDSDKDAATGHEKPQHRVRISKPFYLGKYLVTQEQWQAVMGDNPSRFKGAKNPVENVTWTACRRFLDKLNATAGGEVGKFALPTEAQWEYACRAGSTTRYSFGDGESDLGEYAWYAANSNRKTHPVGKKKPNAWGLYDMHGNVFEWCQDWHDWEYYAKSPADDPTGPATGFARVVRGGAYVDPPSGCRSADRNGSEPGVYHCYLGLRIALAPPE